MKYLKYSYVDSVTGVCITEAPAAGGPADPSVPGLVFGFAFESQFPTATPIMFGTADSVSADTPGVLAVLTKAQYEAALADEMAARAAAAQVKVTATFEQAVQAQLDKAARDRGYDSLATVISYAEEPAVPRFQADGQAFRKWRSLVWDYAHSVLNAVLAGEQAQPELDEFLESLPALELPA